VGEQVRLNVPAFPRDKFGGDALRDAARDLMAEVESGGVPGDRIDQAIVIEPG
jgi:hypothetical protein